MSKSTFVIPQNREAITKEPEALQGRWTAAFPDALSFRQQGGGSVPADYRWRSSPKQWQEEFTAEAFERRQKLLRAEQAVPSSKMLPGGEQR